jgi:hypothetical protein
MVDGTLTLLAQNPILWQALASGHFRVIPNQ